MKSILDMLLGTGSRFSMLEKMVLNSVRDRLDIAMRDLWDKQIQAINKIHRLPEGIEINFYMMKGGRVTFDEVLAFPNKTTELLVATVQIELSGMKKELNAEVWCVNGFLFSIEYDGSGSYFEEAAGMDPQPEFRLTCKMITNLSAAS